MSFKNFAVKGNMVDLAIGIVIGAAFNQIVDVLVKKIIMSPLGYITTIKAPRYQTQPPGQTREIRLVGGDRKPVE